MIFKKGTLTRKGKNCMQQYALATCLFVMLYTEVKDHQEDEKVTLQWIIGKFLLIKSKVLRIRTVCFNIFRTSARNVYLVKDPRSSIYCQNLYIFLSYTFGACIRMLV